LVIEGCDGGGSHPVSERDGNDDQKNKKPKNRSK